jgi:cytochrome c oxidase assembly protein subunit 15
MRRPDVTPTAFRRLAVAAAVAMGAIVVSGAAVRLTGSGLGCPTWPRCTSTSIVAPVSYHALIEFVNRVVTSVVGVYVAVVAVAALLRRPRRRDLTLLAWSLVGGFVGQAVIGGLSVLYDLSPPWVMAHFLLSMLMVWAALVLVHRADPAWTPGPATVRRELLVLGRLLVAVAGVVLVLGTVTTGTGPHAGAGPNQVRRLPFALERVTQLHADSALLLTGLVVATLFAVRLTDTSDVVRRRAAWLAGAVGLQVVIGYTQYFLDLPPGVVELHVAGATVLWASTLWLQLGFSLSQPRGLSGQQQERAEVEQPRDEKQRLVADDQRQVLEAAADHRTEQVGGERRRGVGRVDETLREDQVGGEDRQERDRHRRQRPWKHRQTEQQPGPDQRVEQQRRSQEPVEHA